MLELVRGWRQHDQHGASLVEFGLLVTGIAALIVVVVFAFGGVVKGAFSGSCDKAAERSMCFVRRLSTPGTPQAAYLP